VKALFENIPSESGSSFAYRVYRTTHFPFNWHFHPEIELTLIVRGAGQRFVGDNISPFNEGDLVLLGPDLPHTWMSQPDKRRASQSVVIQFRWEFLGQSLFDGAPEMSSTTRLLDRSARGLHFSGPIRDRIARAMEQMEELSPFRRLIKLLESLDDLARAPAPAVLSSEGFRPTLKLDERKRIDAVSIFLNRQFVRPIGLSEAAAVARLSPRAFTRFFRRATGKTFTDYVNELRVGRACQLMLQSDKNISTIAFDAGFGNLSNFNRRFMRIKGVSPRQFRRSYQLKS
jgi:AraC-like DNA-binding protein